jgi:hypothetical protein
MTRLDDHVQHLQTELTSLRCPVNLASQPPEREKTGGRSRNQRHRPGDGWRRADALAHAVNTAQLDLSDARITSEHNKDATVGALRKQIARQAESRRNVTRGCESVCPPPLVRVLERCAIGRAYRGKSSRQGRCAPQGRSAGRVTALSVLLHRGPRMQRGRPC